jgi:hypothetical protein
MHFYFSGISDERLPVSGFCGREFGILLLDDVVKIEAVFSYC